MRVGRVMIGGVLGCACWVSASHAQDWSLMRPSNTGIPGEEVRTIDFAPDGTIWVSARWPFWGEGGIGVLDRTTQVWSGWSNADPRTGEPDLPTPLINDVAFDANGDVWLSCVGEAVAVLHIGGAGCAADLTGDGVADSNDFFAYLDLFAQGCP